MDEWVLGNPLCLGLGQLIHAWIDHGWMDECMDGWMDGGMGIGIPP